MDPTPIIILSWLILGVIFIVIFDFREFDDQVLIVLLAPIMLLVWGIVIPLRYMIKKFSEDEMGED